MFKLGLNSTLFVLFITVTGFATAACDEPALPTVPDGSTASEAALIEAVGSVKAYQSEVKTYRACVEKMEWDAVQKAKQEDRELSKKEKEKYLAMYNASVEKEKALGENLNAQIRTFKAKAE